MTRCSQSGSEVHSTRQSATTAEPPTAASTQTLDEVVHNTRGWEEWGNKMGKKQHTTVCVLFQNIGRFQMAKEMEVKMEAMQCIVMERFIDILGFTESNTSWDLLQELQ